MVLEAAFAGPHFWTRAVRRDPFDDRTGELPGAQVLCPCPGLEKLVVDRAATAFESSRTIGCQVRRIQAEVAAITAAVVRLSMFVERGEEMIRWNCRASGIVPKKTIPNATNVTSTTSVM